MSFLAHEARQLHVKIVYEGSPLVPKTTNLQWLYDHAPHRSRGLMTSLATETERAVFFDFVPAGVPLLDGFTLRAHLYTLPGTIRYHASRRLLPRGLDGLVMVTESDPLRWDSNAWVFDDVDAALREIGYDPLLIPRVLQYNKRDRPNAVPVEELAARFNPRGDPDFAAIASEGVGVQETFDAIIAAVCRRQGGARALDPPRLPE